MSASLPGSWRPNWLQGNRERQNLSLRTFCTSAEGRRTGGRATAACCVDDENHLTLVIFQVDGLSVDGFCFEIESTFVVVGSGHVKECSEKEGHGEGKTHADRSEEEDGEG